jgi:hypothetical protein
MWATDSTGRQITSDGPKQISSGDKVKIADGNGGWKPGTMVGGTAVETK